MANAVNGKDKIRILFQSDRELAEAAVGEILRYYRVRARIIPEGMEDYEEILEYLLRPSGILRRRVRLTEGWYKDAAGAMLGSKKDGTMVALIPGKLRGYTIVDPASGKNEVVNARTAAELDTDAVCFYKPFPLKAIGVKDVIFHVISLLRTRDYAWMIGLTAVITLIQAIGPIQSGVPGNRQSSAPDQHDHGPDPVRSVKDPVQPCQKPDQSEHSGSAKASGRERGYDEDSVSADLLILTL